MSVTINGEEINIYEDDTDLTFNERIASHFNTIPSFIDKKISISSIKESGQDNINIITEEIKDYHKNNRGKTEEEFIQELSVKYPLSNFYILKLFMSYHPKFDFKKISSEKEDDLAFDIMPLEQSFKEKLDIDFNIVRFINDDKENFLKDINSKIKNNKEKSKEVTKIYKKLKEIEPYEEYEIKKEDSFIKIVTNLEKDKFSLSTIFANMVAFETSPYISYSSIYKIYENLGDNIPLDWQIDDQLEELKKEIKTFYGEGKLEPEDFILLKVYNDNDFTNCYIMYNDDNKLVIYVKVDYNSIKIPLKTLKRRVYESFTNIQDFEIDSQSEEYITCTVNFPKHKFDTYAMSYLLMTNKIFSIYIAVDESIQASKKRSGLYTHYFIQNYEGKCNITSNDSYLGIPDTYFVKLNVKKGKNIKIIQEFITLFSKVLRVYYETKDSIIDFYKKYIPNFGEEKSKKEKKREKLTLQQQVPDLFVKGYAEKCQLPQQPSIISKEEAKQYDDDRIMEFPKTENEGKKHVYVCDDNEGKYMYIGLRRNKALSNRDRYKYIPCCFVRNQKNKKTYREYFEDEQEEKGIQQKILTTNKIAPYDEYAYLPENINYLLSSIDDKYTYLRKGVNDTKQSFLECVLESCLEPSKFSNRTQENKLEILEKEYEKLINYEKLAVASQENPGLNEDDMKDILENREYMDPRRWITLLETIYDCKIIILSREMYEEDVAIEIPYHSFVYLRQDKTPKKIVVIYEHSGNESVKTDYPRCELVMKWDQDVSMDEGIYSYFTGKMAKTLVSFYNEMLDQYYYSISKKGKIEKIPEFSLENIYKLNPNSQIIDNYGKCRGIVINDIILLCDPIPPLNLTAFYENFYETSTINDTLELLENIRDYTEIKSQCVKDGNVKELNISVIGINTIFTIKVEDNKGKIIDDVKVVDKEMYPNINYEMRDVNRNKRKSLLITEYFIYYYSYYINNTKKEISLLSIKEFIEDMVVIRESKYKIQRNPYVSIEKLVQANFMFENKFIVDSRETLKRLVYCLRLRLANVYDSVLNYYQQSEIYNFYKNIKYYNTDNTNIVIKKLSDFQNIDNTVYDKLKVDDKKFFVKLEDISENPCLIIKAKNKGEAETISTDWIKYEKIVDISDISNDPEKYSIEFPNTNFYFYESKRDITLVKDEKIKGQNYSDVLVYKKDTKLNYVALNKL